MSRHGEITIPWGDGEYKFRLGYGEIRQLQEVCDAGPAWIANRLRGDQWHVDDIRETIRLGLIGAGMTQADALAKVSRLVDNVPLRENCLIAWAILQAAIIGAPEEAVVGKPSGASSRKARRSREAKSPSPSSSAQPQSSDSPQPSSTQ